MAEFESEDLAFLRALLGGDGLSGPGDDAAVFHARGRIVATCDGLIEGVHFETGTRVADVAHKLLHRNLSDLAAMGALPGQVLTSFQFSPEWSTRSRRGLYRALLRSCERVGAGWIGGDLAATPGPTSLQLTALGAPAGRKLLRRSALRPGDLLAVSGPLGDSFASGHHLRFQARLELGARLASAHRVRAAMDLSDGLALDLSRMLDASGALGATLDAASLPLRRSLCGRPRESAWSQALGDGEDYELLVGFAPEELERLEADAEIPRQLCRPIGVVEREPGLRLRRPDASVRACPVRGWLHGQA